jgi:hypothetical protein
MRFVGHVTRVGVKNLKERNHLEDLGVDLSVILKCIFKNGGGGGGGLDSCVSG